MKKRIPFHILYHSTLKKILEYMKINNIGINEPIIVGDDFDNHFSPSVLYEFVCSGYDINSIKELIKRGANVNIVNKLNCKQSMFEHMIENNNLYLLYICLPHFKLKSNYSLMKCVYDNLKYEKKITRKVNLLNRLSSMFRQDKWERIKYSLDNDPYKGAKTLEEYDDILFRRNWTCGKCTTIEEGENCPNCAFNNPDYEYPFDSPKTFIPKER
jgi:rubrerythrin